MICLIGKLKKILEAQGSLNSPQLLWLLLLLISRLLIKERRNPAKPVMLSVLNQRNWFLVLDFGHKKRQRKQGQERIGFCWSAEMWGAQTNFSLSGIEKYMRDIVVSLMRYSLKVQIFSSSIKHLHLGVQFAHGFSETWWNQVFCKVSKIKRRSKTNNQGQIFCNRWFEHRKSSKHSTTA